jgi:hypothetical protein
MPGRSTRHDAAARVATPRQCRIAASTERGAVRAGDHRDALAAARRGELQCPLPVGFVYSANNEPVLDPDKQVQESIRFFFETFRRTASARMEP